MDEWTKKKRLLFLADQKVPNCEFHTLTGECGEIDDNYVRIPLVQFNPIQSGTYLLNSYYVSGSEPHT